MIARAHRRVGRCALVMGLVCLVGLGLADAVRAFGTASRVTTPARLAITGFQSESTSPSAIDRSRSALSTVGVDGVNLGPGGRTVGVPDAAALAQLTRSHADGLRAELLVGNFSDRINDFSEPLAYGLLGSPTRIARVAAAISDRVIAEDWNGVSLDLESLRARDGAGLVRLVRALQARLPADDTVSVCVMTEGSQAGYRAAGYRLAALGHAASRLILMAYDEHGPWESTPGPVGALSWQRAGLRGLLAVVPADRVDLGVAGYGYAWGPHRRLQLSDAAARRLVARAGIRPRWSARVGEWTARLPDGTIVWWSDARSFALRRALAARLRLHGLAVWSLGLSDPVG